MPLNLNSSHLLIAMIGLLIGLLASKGFDTSTQITPDSQTGVWVINKPDRKVTFCYAEQVENHFKLDCSMSVLIGEKFQS